MTLKPLFFNCFFAHLSLRVTLLSDNGEVLDIHQLNFLKHCPEVHVGYILL